MNKFWRNHKSCILAIIFAIVILLVVSWIEIPVRADNDMYSLCWNNCTDEQRYYLPAEFKAAACGMTTEEFIFLAQCVEAESDRNWFEEGTTTDSRIYVAVVMLDRLYSSAWPNTINGVLTQSGQFLVVSNGRCYISSTLASEWAIVEAQRLIHLEEVPANLYYFNCVGYNRSSNEQYGYIGGNYFMLG